MALRSGGRLLEVVGLSKRFGATQALDDVAFALEGGTVHGLIGENGAGKSTLIKILTGACPADAGSIFWKGSALHVGGPTDATAAGIAVLHQEPQLVDSLSALENLFLGRPGFGSGRFGTISRRTLERRARELCARYDVVLPLDVPARELSPARRTLLGLLRCLLDAPRLLILDEPTTSLGAADVAWLGRVTAALAASGSSVLFVSHRLDEILSLCSHVTVMRNGRVADNVATAGQSRHSLVGMMSGAMAAPLEPQARPASALPGPVLLEIAHLSTADGKLNDLSLTARAGELVGLYGLAGAGRSELLETVFGARTRARGTVSVGGRSVRPSPASSMRAGLSLVPEDRKRQALLAGRSILENVNLPYLRRFARLGVVRARAERRSTAEAVRVYGIKARGIDQGVNELSGGNQQKVVFARTWGLSPRVLLCDEPTQGVDVTTRRAIHDALRAHAEQGGTALVVTSDLEELMALADRIFVLCEGRISGTFERAAFDARTILQACFAHAAPAAAAPLDAR